MMLASFFVPGGAAQSGWTSYAPLSIIAGTGQTVWLIGMVFLITSSLSARSTSSSRRSSCAPRG